MYQKMHGEKQLNITRKKPFWILVYYKINFYIAKVLVQVFTGY